MFFTVVFAVLLAVAAAAPDGGWSWGSEEKNTGKVEQAAVPVVEQGRSLTHQLTTSGNVVEIQASDFNEPLPLEPHAPSVVEQAQLIGQSSQIVGDEETEADRQARFLGITDTLCDWGVGIRVSLLEYVFFHFVDLIL